MSTRAIVALLLMPSLIVAAYLGNPDVTAAGLILALIVFFMGFLAALIGGGFAKTHFQAREAGLSPFTLARPMSSGGLVAAKLKTAALSGLAGWVLVALVVPPFFALMGYAGPLATLWGQLLPDRSLLELLVIVPLMVAALLVLTWKGLVGGLTVGLTGRTWIGVVNFCCRLRRVRGSDVAGPLAPDASRDASTVLAGLALVAGTGGDDQGLRGLLGPASGEPARAHFDPDTARRAGVLARDGHRTFRAALDPLARREQVGRSGLVGGAPVAPPGETGGRAAGPGLAAASLISQPGSRSEGPLEDVGDGLEPGQEGVPFFIAEPAYDLLLGRDDRRVIAAAEVAADLAAGGAGARPPRDSRRP